MIAHDSKSAFAIRIVKKITFASKETIPLDVRWSNHCDRLSHNRCIGFSNILPIMTSTIISNSFFNTGNSNILSFVLD